MVYEFINKYRHFFFLACAAAVYFTAVELADLGSKRATTPVYGEYIDYTCTTGRVTVVSISNGRFKPLLFVNTDTAEGLTPRDFYTKHGKCIMFERKQPFYILPEGISPYLPVISKANQEGQYE